MRRLPSFPLSFSVFPILFSNRTSVMIITRMTTWVITHIGATIGNRVGDQEPQGQRVRLTDDPFILWLTKLRNEPIFSSGNRLAVVLEAVPEEPTSPLLSHQVRSSDHPVCLSHHSCHTQSPLSLGLIEVCVCALCCLRWGCRPQVCIAVGTCPINVVCIS